MLREVLAVLEYESVQIHKRSDPIWKLVGDSRDNASTIGMTAEHNIRPFFPLDQIDDVQDVCVEVDVSR
jgi:hypothetical protein